MKKKMTPENNPPKNGRTLNSNFIILINTIQYGVVLIDVGCCLIDVVNGKRFCSCQDLEHIFNIYFTVFKDEIFMSNFLLLSFNFSVLLLL